MNAETLQALATNPPPKNGKWRIHNANAARARIAELETALGVQSETPSWNIGVLNARVETLEAMLAERVKNLPAVITPVAPSPTSTARPISPWSQYEAITDAAEKTRFYRLHSEAMDAEFRKHRAKAPAVKPIISTVKVEENSVVAKAAAKLSMPKGPLHI